MGCKCCRMIQRFGFDIDDPSPDYINDVSKQKPNYGPDLQKHEAHFDGLKNIENKRGPYGSQDDHRNTPENVILAGKENCPEKGDANRNGDISNTSLYTSAKLNASARRETYGEGTTTLPDFDGNCHIAKGISQEHLICKEPDLEFYTNRTLASEQPESLQDEICQSMEGNSSLTESAILDIRSDIVSQNTHNRKDCDETDRSASGYLAPPNTGGSSESVNCVYPEVDYQATNLPLYVDIKFEGIGFRGHAATYPRREELDYEDIDSDVAEALAALAAAIAGEYYSDEDFTGKNEYGY